MQLDVNKVIEEYDRLFMEMNKRIILLKVENEQLKKLLEDRKDSE